jgi:hypothetical protein
MGNETTNEVTRSTAIEITASGATLLEIQSSDSLATVHAKVGSVSFDESQINLADPESVGSFVEVLRPLVQQFSLQGQAVSVLLSGEYCSTRVLRGDEDAIRRGMQNLEKLKQHYMGLGRGEKALASVVRSVDARNERATVAVAVESTLEVLIEASQRLGVELETVEPAANGLTRLCGHLDIDRTQPVALISTDAGGTDIVLSFEGDLLLHHRLRAPLATEGEVERIRQQMCLLAQYSARFSQAARENALPVYVVGAGPAIEHLVEKLEADTDIDLRTFDVEQSLPAWNWDNQQETPWAVVGGCLRSFVGQLAAPAPDMVHNLTGTSHLKFIQARRKMIFPLIAAALIGIAVGFAAIWENSAAAGLEENLNRFKSVEDQLELTKMQLMKVKQFNKSTQGIGSQVSGVDWRRELQLLAQCKPAGVWLKRVTLRQDGTLSITGTGKDDASIYEFKKWLNQAPPFGHVELTSTRDGQRTAFEMECDIRGRGGY